MQRIYPLESLRGLAALVVVVYHFDGQFWSFTDSAAWFTSNRFVQHATLMVDFFFVLSGFVIALTYAGRINSFHDAFTFQVKRFWRLYPLHLVTLLAFVGIESLKLVAPGGETPAFSANDAEALVNNILLTQSFYLDHLTFNYPSWSISTEFYTYMIFAVVVLLARRRLAVGAAAMILVAGTLLLINGGLVGEAPFLVPRCVYSFFIGVLTHKAFTTCRRTPPAYLLLLSCIAAATFAEKGTQILVPWLFGLTVYAIAKTERGVVNRALSARWLVFLGTISYSIYMTHALVWWFLKQGIRVAGVRLDTVSATFVLLAGLALTIAVSTLSFRLIEERFRKGIR